VSIDPSETPQDPGSGPPQQGESSEGFAERLFRKDAWELYQRGDREGELLRTSPKWIVRAYRLLVVVFATLAVLLISGKSTEYAQGPAILRAQGRVDLSAKLAGTVRFIDVLPGQKVSTGQVLVRFDDTAEQAELERVRREFDQRLVESLRSPSDAVIKQALTTLYAQRELAEANLTQRRLVAPRDGVVSDVRIRPAQYLAAGERVLSLTDEQGRFEIVAALPGAYRPTVHVGAPMRLEISGFRFAYQDLTVERAETQVIGKEDVRAYLGPSFAENLPQDAAVFLVTGSTPSGHFDADGQAFAYHDGMTGTVRAKAKETRLLFLVFPWLRPLFK
jgi:membrane fusion protein (multidrug efflux system)